MTTAADEAIARAQVSPWSTKAKIGRALWMLLRIPLFRMSWHNWYGYRRWLLRLFGAKIGKSCVIRPTAKIEIPWLLELGDYSSLGDSSIIYNLGQITIGRRVTVSQYAHLCAGSHNFSRRDMPLLRPTITVGDDAWIAAESFVAPGINVGEGAILGARGAAFKDVPAWEIWGGNPARKIRDRGPVSDEPDTNEQRTA
ncbi:MAG: WcaF family extracellular polysaccharide biosynthesis acetyltransferase [Planctomycetota bacterium]